MSGGEVYWTYVPDLPILHPSIWEGPEFVVRVNDTCLLDQPSMGKIQTQTETEFNYTVSGNELSICFSKK